LLTKPSASMFIILTPSLLLLTPPKKWIKKIKSLILPGAITGIIALSIYSLLRVSNAFHLINSRSADYLRTPAEFFSSWFEFFPDTLNVYLSWILSYLTFPVVIALIIIWLLAILKKNKSIFILSLWIIIPVIIQASIGKIVYPRYLLPIIPFIIIIISWGLTKIKKPLSILFIVVTAFYWLKFDYLLLTNPTKAPLPEREQTQYFYEWSAGYGLKEITNYLNKLPKDQDVLVATEGSFGTLPNGLEIFFDQSKNILIQGIGFPEDKIHQDMKNSLNEDKLVFLVFNKDRINHYDKNRFKLIEQYPRPSGEILLFLELLPIDN
ncbi:MAG: hypothetical protein ABII08_01945, partial [Candidatus Beckwithbacteria bacterium]